jgi:ketosteroid isomerase-like protein
VDTRETVDELLRRVADGAPEKIAELYAADVDWMLDWPDDDYSQTVPWIRHRSTRAGVADHFRLIAEHHVPDESSATVGAVLVDGTDAMVLGEFHNTAKPTGRRYVAAFALHLTVEHGLITRHHVYEDSLAVAGAFATDDHSPRV